MNLYIYQNWKPKEWERKTWITSVPKIERKKQKLRANPSVHMGGSGELSLGSIHHRSPWCCGASLPSALCSRCSHVCETMEKKVIIGFFVLKRNRGFLWQRSGTGKEKGNGRKKNQNLVFFVLLGFMCYQVLKKNQIFFFFK